MIRLLALRGLNTPEEIKNYLDPRLDRLPSPWTLKDMEEAVDLCLNAHGAAEEGEPAPIRIFGDYDVDGTTGAALLTWFFREFGIRTTVEQPDRFRDGYGLNVAAVERAAESGASILLTVDCGVTSFAALERARELGLETIVLDHHQVDPVRGLPPASAIVNPQRPDRESGLKQLCGCGIAFYFAMAMRARAREIGLFEGRAEPNLKHLLDLVVIATAADQVPLVGVNRTLVAHGLQVLKNSNKPGVRALLDVAGVNTRNLSPSHLGFTLGPRINASGRMQSASHALELLTTQDEARAYELAETLEALNKERADTQNRIWDQVKAEVESRIQAGEFRHGIVVANREWHEGVVGIVASRVTETFHRPAAIISLREDFGKGSVRSFAGKDVLLALQKSAEHLKTFGGHRHAAGLSIEIPNVDAFARAFDAALSEIPTDESDGALYIEGECDISELDYKTLQEIERMGPFGNGNPEPVFRVVGRVRNPSLLKGRHLKFSLVPDAQTPGAIIEAIWFHADERREKLMELGRAEWAAVPELNRFGGRVTPTLRVRDLRFDGI